MPRDTKRYPFYSSIAQPIDIFDQRGWWIASGFYRASTDGKHKYIDVFRGKIDTIERVAHDFKPCGEPELQIVALNMQ